MPSAQPSVQSPASAVLQRETENSDQQVFRCPRSCENRQATAEAEVGLRLECFGRQGQACVQARASRRRRGGPVDGVGGARAAPPARGPRRSRRDSRVGPCPSPSLRLLWPAVTLCSGRAGPCPHLPGPGTAPSWPSPSTPLRASFLLAAEGWGGVHGHGARPGPSPGRALDARGGPLWWDCYEPQRQSLRGVLAPFRWAALRP